LDSPTGWAPVVLDDSRSPSAAAFLQNCFPVALTSKVTNSPSPPLPIRRERIDAPTSHVVFLLFLWNFPVGLERGKMRIVTPPLKISKLRARNKRRTIGGVFQLLAILSGNFVRIEAESTE